MAAIGLEDVWKVFADGTEAVRALDLDITDGEFMVLVGPSGCGKTTALRMVAGLEAVTKGTIRIGERVVNDVPPKDRDIAMVFQHYALYPHMTVFENMAFGLKLQKLGRDEISRRVGEAARILGLGDLLKRKPKALSGGQRQRVAMGRAIVRHPHVFLMDEPLSNLDAYRTALDAGGFANAFLNSLAVAVPATVIPITIAAFAAYAFSWMEFPGRNVLFVLVVGLMVVPLQMALIPILRLYTGGAHIGGVSVFPDLDLGGTFLGIWLAHTGFGIPLATYLLRNYIGSLPSSIIESAKIDGADHFIIFWRLIIPLSVPALAAFAIFQFLWVWNDLLVAYVFLGGGAQARVLTIALADLVGSRGENWHVLTAAAFISMSLPLAVFFSLQRYFVRGLTAGSVKG